METPDGAVQTIAPDETGLDLEATAPPTGPDLSIWKIPPRRVPSDDCKVVLGRQLGVDPANPKGPPIVVDQGETYYPHEGECVWVLPIGNLQAYLEMARFEELSAGANGIVGLRKLDDKLVDLCGAIANVVVWWDWTDNMRRPLPQPFENPKILHTLEVDELLWLSGAAQGEAPSERKNGSAPSRATRRASVRRSPKR